MEDWSFFEAFYFTIITLTTIGIGDFTPSTSPPERHAIRAHNESECLKALIYPYSGTGEVLVRNSDTGLPNACDKVNIRGDLVGNFACIIYSIQILNQFQKILKIAF